MTCRVCHKIILATESHTFINDDHYHRHCLERQTTKRENLVGGENGAHPPRPEGAGGSPW